MRELTIVRAVYEQMVSHCFEAYPYEGCGLLAALSGTESAIKCYPTRNTASSARVYTIDPKDYLAADRDAERQSLEIIAVFHSHTHTDAYPSPTDVSQAPVGEWHYVLVSFAAAEPSVRSFRILDGKIDEESVVVAQ